MTHLDLYALVEYHRACMIESINAAMDCDLAGQYSKAESFDSATRIHWEWMCGLDKIYRAQNEQMKGDSHESERLSGS